MVDTIDCFFLLTRGLALFYRQFVCGDASVNLSIFIQPLLNSPPNDRVPMPIFALKTKSLLNDERGFVVSTELILLATIAVIGSIVGITSVRDAMISELSDVAGSVQDLNQCYSFNGITGHSSSTCGSDFRDALDFCDDADDAAGAIDNCIVFDSPEDESGGDTGGDTGGGGGGVLIGTPISVGTLIPFPRPAIVPRPVVISP